MSSMAFKSPPIRPSIFAKTAEPRAIKLSALSLSALGLSVSSMALAAPAGASATEAAASAAPVAAAATSQNFEQSFGTPASDNASIARSVERWNYLRSTKGLSFNDYASFVITYPDYPLESTIQRRAEAALENEAIGAQTLVAFFDKNPPITNAAKARYALALSSMRREEAFEVARDAWRGGTMSGTSEAYLLGQFGPQMTPEDHDARMNALLWQRDVAGATRQIVRATPATRDLAMARLALIQGETPSQAGLTVPTGALSDPGYVYNLARHYRVKRQISRSINLLATRPNFTKPALNQEAMVGEILRAAKAADARTTITIASKVDDLFEPGEDVSTKSFRLRDDYTTLMWMGGTNALWRLGNGNSAAPLFYRYGAAAQTPQTRSKGFYWAGRAAKSAGNSTEANRYFELAAAYPDRFYGQLSLNELGRPMPELKANLVAQEIAPEARDAFNNQPLTMAVRYVARGAPWRTGIQFYRAISRSADTPQEHELVAGLAREIGRRDLSVNVAEAAGADGLNQFVVQGFPVLPIPAGTNFTLTHAITRQESQFAQNAISHAGARGLMQLIPSTAREEARFAGLSYATSRLIDDPQYNVQLGSNHIERLVSRYNGSYPLAFAAYNAGPGNVNKWLRANGDPRTGAISWVEWIERIPFFETKNYVARVIENAAVYEHLNPERAEFGRARMAHEFLR